MEILYEFPNGERLYLGVPGDDINDVPGADRRVTLVLPSGRTKTFQCLRYDVLDHVDLTGVDPAGIEEYLLEAAGDAGVAREEYYKYVD